jgi:hypothetical protein
MQRAVPFSPLPASRERRCRGLPAGRQGWAQDGAEQAG